MKLLISKTKDVKKSRKFSININTLRILIVIAVVSLTTGCKKMFEVDENKSRINYSVVFEDEGTATAAVLGMYREAASRSLMGGGQYGISVLPGLSADEMRNIMRFPSFLFFEENNLTADNSRILNIWNGAYKVIYKCNDIIEGASASTGLPESTKKQITAEAKFMRGFIYFNLVNLFGGIPIVTETSFQINSNVTRASEAEVYQQIIKDLSEAHLALTQTPFSERVRANKTAAAALLSRVYLYEKNWEKATQLATEAIGQVDYAIMSDLSKVFKNGSKEIIFQLPFDDGYNTQDAEMYLLTYGISDYSTEITNSLAAEFSPTDLRFTNWISKVIEGGVEYKIPYKYKIFPWDGPVTEYFVLIRLAEVYLIRSEANARNGRLAEAIADVDVIRNRAGLNKIADTNPGISAAALLVEIQKQRRLELFGECGHRWFDLKRWQIANQVLGTKPGWTANDLLYPLPAEEFKKNPKLGNQNPGY